MLSPVIWVVIYARPRREIPLRPLFDERKQVGADLMYINRFRDATALKTGDRVVVHFGGPRGSDPYAQHVVQAGFVTEKARSLNQQDLKELKSLLDLTLEMFPHFQTAPGLLERQGIIRYKLFDLPPSVQPLPRPYPQPRPGMNFIRLMPDDPEYPQVDAWWHAVLPRDQCSKE